MIITTTPTAATATGGGREKGNVTGALPLANEVEAALPPAQRREGGREVMKGCFCNGVRRWLVGGDGREEEGGREGGVEGEAFAAEGGSTIADG